MADDPIKQALRMLPYGFYSITSCTEDDANAMVANWITQVSFEPRLVAVGLQKTSYTHGLIEQGGKFAINIVREEDADLIKPLTKGREKNPDKMKEIAHSPAPKTGCPILEGVAAYLECEVVDLIDVGGDHDILVGEVVGAEVMKPGEPEEMLSLPDLGWSYAG